MNGLEIFENAWAKYPALMRKAYGADRSTALNAYAEELITARAACATRTASQAAEESAGVQRLSAIENSLTERRQRAQQVRARKIEREYQALRAEGHDQAYARHFAAYNVDNAERFAAQSAAHQARTVAAVRPAEPARPAPLRLVPRFDTHDLQTLAAGFGSRIP